MKQILITLLMFVGLLNSTLVKAQQFQTPSLPTTKEEFISSEKDFIAAAKWLETTKVDLNATNRKEVNAWTLAWIINSPTVTVEIRSSILKAYEKNAQLNVVFLAGYGRYSLENSYSKDDLKCTVAAMKAVINCYKLGGEIKKDKNLEKVIEKDNEGKLEEWIKEALAKKG